MADTVAALTSAEVAGELQPGADVEHFRVERLLGRGGMGEVYLALDTQLERRVALKVIRRGPELSDDAVRRLMDEARTTARFSHPNVVTIYHVGRTPRGSPYLALEYVEGETLRDRLARGPMSTAEIVVVLSAVASALGEARGHGVLHRDLKPENVMLGRDGRPRVLDFGLAVVDDAAAKPAGPPDAGALAAAQGTAEVTHSHTLRGTPAYMAPEQWRGEAISEATDVWALGVMLYEAITGQRPFRAPSLAALCMRVLDHNPAPSLAPYAANVPTALRGLCEGCLAKRPQRRPTVPQVIATLATVAAQTPGAAPHAALTSAPVVAPPLVKAQLQSTEAPTPDTVGLGPTLPPSALQSTSAQAVVASVAPTTGPKAPVAPGPVKRGGTALVVIGAILLFFSFGALGANAGLLLEGYSKGIGLEIVGMLLFWGIPAGGGSTMLVFGFRRRPSPAALMVLGVIIAIVGGVAAASFFAAAKARRFAAYVAAGALFGLPALIEGVLLIVYASRAIKRLARATTAPPAP